MKFKSTLILLSLAIALSNLSAPAQINPEAFGLYNEALLFSQTKFNGSARIQAIGGAQVALGGDMSSATSNPAGLGFFNRSQFSLSPSINFHQSDASYGGNSILTESENFNFNQLGVVLNKSKEDNGDGFRGGSFAITVVRTNSFKQEFTYDGFSNESSIADFFIEQANGLPSSVLENENAIFDSGTEVLSLAFNSFVINPEANNQYSTFLGIEPRQQETVRLSGAQYQWNFAAGGNYMDKLYFGGGVGIATLDYKVKKTFRESEYLLFDDPDQVDDGVNNVFLAEETNIDGIGVNLTLGVIFRPVDMVTVGLSYVSPTWYKINDETFSDLSVSYNNINFNGEILNDFDWEGRIFESNYSLRTPSKLNLGLAYFFGKHGFLTGDVEMVDYSNANLGSDDFSPAADNQTIRSLYKRVINFRLGTEYRIDNFRLRAGYAYRADPVEDPVGDRKEESVTFGVGYRNKKFFADLGVVNTYGDKAYSPYFLSDDTQPSIALDKRSTNVVLTVGVSF